MTKKRFLLLAALPFAVCVALGVLVMVSAMVPPSPGITKANFNRIQDGMMLAEVEEIFGHGGVSIDGQKTEQFAAGEGYLFWRADDGSSASIEFEDDCVTRKDWHESNETILDKLRRWLHLP
jgi:hypothetical protein